MQLIQIGALTANLTILLVPRISGWGKKRGAASVAVEQKARSLLPQSDLPALAYYMEEYAGRRLTPDAFLTVLRDLLDTQQKVSPRIFT